MVVGRLQRRMAAILAADVVGYSRLMGKDEEGTLATLTMYRQAIDGLIARHDMQPLLRSRWRSQPVSVPSWASGDSKRPSARPNSPK